MGLLTKKLQKLCIIVVLGVFTLTIVLLSDYSRDTVLAIPEHTQSVKDMKYQFLYYQELMKNYTSGFYSEDGDVSNGSNEGSSKMSQLLTPAFSESISKQKALKRNEKYMASIMKKKISEPKGFKLSKISEYEDKSSYKLENATFVSLVRNSELRGIISTIVQVEATFNDKYHYPYVFLNDQPFTEKFKQAVQKLTKSKCYFELVDAKDWDKPSNIDPIKEKEGIKYLVSKGVGYSKKTSYHNMCRYYSRGFYKHERLLNFKYYWRIEPNTDYFCDIDYDVFKFMRDNDKIYGYVINLYDSPDSVKTLWPTTIEFLSKNPNYLHENSASIWLRENLQNPDNYKIANGYSTCHFWSNFEVGDMDFYRGEAYSKWVDYLEESGGFYYERWGDAPVHSVGLGLFADKSKIHWFRDIGYHHAPYINCPNSDKCRNRCKSKNKMANFENLSDQDCGVTWIKYEMTPEQLEEY